MNNLDSKYLILVLWFVLTAFNINKAYHIDDTFHIEAAEWIIEHPTHPMSGTINWNHVPEKIHTFNQPPLLFYLIALVIKLFGHNPIALHLFISVFTLLALYFFSNILRLIKSPHQKVLLCLFAFNPAFIINQNLMTDIPLLSVLLASVYYLLKSGVANKHRNYLISAIFIGIGMLIKYTFLPFILVFILYAYIRKELKYTIYLLVPIGLLILWSTWNYFEFGAIHITNRDKGSPHIKYLWMYFMTLGAITVIPMSLIGIIKNQHILKFVSIILILFFPILVISLYFINYNKPILDQWLIYWFILNGIVITFMLLFSFITQMRTNSKEYLTSANFIFCLVAGGFSAFVILFAPFMASRHLLLVIPFILLILNNKLFLHLAPVRIALITTTIILGILLGISDWMYADYYRKLAASINKHENNQWFAGHWGWQYYAGNAGLKQFNGLESEILRDDLVYIPKNISQQSFPETITMEIIDKKWLEPNFLTFVSGHEQAGLYSTLLKYPVWTFSKTPVDTLFVYRVLNATNESSIPKTP
jgi:4-amino-4-deoxy-L-arabinose transferase-like glycosyltransferase